MTISEPALLSIVSPTRGNFSDYWLEQLLNIKGDVEFVLIYPPGVTPKPVEDSRVKNVISPYKGEIIQRFVGLLNATGKYVLALDDDDFAHPDIYTLVRDYFVRFPQSWVLRLYAPHISYTEQEKIRSPWPEIPDVKSLTVRSRKDAKGDSPQLLELPIAPLENKFDRAFLFSPLHKRKDMHGPHIENFNNKVWRNDLVQESLADLSKNTQLVGHLTWIPKWSLDRLLGLYLQAKFYEKDKIVGHWMPEPEQVRYIVVEQAAKGDFRLILPSDLLLAKRFPQYGYFWNLFFEQLWLDLKKVTKKALVRETELKP